MGWPKGKPRRGHINKDGTPHKTRGSFLDVPDVRPKVGTDDVPVVSKEVQVEADVPARSSGSYEGEIHGQVGSGAITSVCPNCGYAYADGGYCNDCGWTKPIQLDDYGTNVGRRF